MDSIFGCYASDEFPWEETWSPPTIDDSTSEFGWVEQVKRAMQDQQLQRIWLISEQTHRALLDL